MGLGSDGNISVDGIGKNLDNFSRIHEVEGVQAGLDGLHNVNSNLNKNKKIKVGCLPIAKVKPSSCKTVYFAYFSVLFTQQLDFAQAYSVLAGASA